MFGFRNRRKVRTSTYSLELSFRSREGVVAIYRDEAGQLVLYGERVGTKWKWTQLNLRIPRDLSSPTVERIVPRLAEALATLRYDFVILRVGPPEPIPEAEMAAAAAQLREMGYEPSISNNGAVNLQKGANWKKPSLDEAKRRAVELMRLCGTVRGKRGAIEILAKSESANAEFV
jgi:hypothetical protein